MDSFDQETMPSEKSLKAEQYNFYIRNIDHLLRHRIIIHWKDNYRKHCNFCVPFYFYVS